jgi:hypothetical protein
VVGDRDSVSILLACGLYPIPSALGSQISSGLVSSTVGDHVRSPGTVRFVLPASHDSEIDFASFIEREGGGLVNDEGGIHNFSIQSHLQLRGGATGKRCGEGESEEETKPSAPERDDNDSLRFHHSP